MAKSNKSSNKTLNKVLKVFGILFIIAIIGIVVLGFGFNRAFKQYDKVNNYCTNALRSEVTTIYDEAEINIDGSRYIDGVRVHDLEAFLEKAYYLCMNKNGIPDSFLKFKSPYLFD